MRPPSQLPQTQLGRMRVLIVDSTRNCGRLVRELKASGYAVDVARRRSEACRLAAKAASAGDPFFATLVGYGFRKGSRSGLQLLRDLQDASRKTHLAVVTRHPESNLVSNALTLDVSYLIEPL